jgi:hypothetical protein
MQTWGSKFQVLTHKPSAYSTLLITIVVRYVPTFHMYLLILGSSHGVFGILKPFNTNVQQKVIKSILSNKCFKRNTWFLNFCLSRLHNAYLVKKLIKAFWHEVGNLLLDKLHNNGFTFSCASPLVHFFVVPCQNILRTGPMIATKWLSHCTVGEV